MVAEQRETEDEDRCGAYEYDPEGENEDAIECGMRFLNGIA